MIRVTAGLETAGLETAGLETAGLVTADHNGDAPVFEECGGTGSVSEVKCRLKQARPVPSGQRLAASLRNLRPWRLLRRLLRRADGHRGYRHDSDGERLTAR